MIRKLCIAIYMAVACFVLRGVVRKMRDGRSRYIDGHVGSRGFVKVYVRIITMRGGTAYMLGERVMHVNVIPKKSGDHVKIDAVVRKNIKSFVMQRLMARFNDRFGFCPDMRIMLSVSTSKTDEETVAIVNTLKKYGLTKERLMAKYPALRKAYAEVAEWFDNVSLAAPIYMDSV